MPAITKAPFIWGTFLSAESSEQDSIYYASPDFVRSYDRFNHFDNAEWGKAILYWDYKYRFDRANRRANKILKPIFEDAGWTFPRARGEAFVREGQGERYHLYFPHEKATVDECVEWGEGNLTPGSYFFQGMPDIDLWLLILGDDENDH